MELLQRIYQNQNLMYVVGQSCMGVLGAAFHQWQLANPYSVRLPFCYVLFCFLPATLGILTHVLSHTGYSSYKFFLEKYATELGARVLALGIICSKSIN